MNSSAVCRLRSLLVVLAGLAVVLAPVHAQSTGGRVIVQVSDPSRAVLAQAAVRLVSESTGFVRSAETNASGDYVFGVAIGFDRSAVKATAMLKKALAKGGKFIALQVLATKAHGKGTKQAKLAAQK